MRRLGVKDQRSRRRAHASRSAFRQGQAGPSPRKLLKVAGAAYAKDDTIHYSPKDIEAEHDQAVASLSPAQRRAFARIDRPYPALEAQFALEAEGRSFRPANDDRVR